MKIINKLQGSVATMPFSLDQPRGKVLILDRQERGIVLTLGRDPLKGIPAHWLTSGTDHNKGDLSIYYIYIQVRLLEVPYSVSVV